MRPSHDGKHGIIRIVCYSIGHHFRVEYQLMHYPGIRSYSGSYDHWIL